MKVSGLFTGRIEDRWPGRPPSAIGKQPAPGPQRLETLGFEMDAQADLTVHGGPDKAVHHYAGEHYAEWRAEFPQLADKFHPGGFGENISTEGMTEETLCIGDIFALGTARVQISQGRQPCWKLNNHIGEKTMAARFQKTVRTGWYYRVLEPGSVEVGDEFTLLERLNPDWTLIRVIAARFNARLDPETAATLARLPALAEGWRESFAKKCDASYVEDTAPRLVGS